jgi:hypothetical protein
MENKELIKKLIENYKVMIEENLRDEQDSETPDKTLIEDYENALTMFDEIGEHKMLTYIYDFILEQVGL